MLSTLEGRGLEDVLDIKASVLTSIIWLNPLEAPVIKIPPRINFKNTKDPRFPSASKYPKNALITTSEDNLSFNRET